MGCGGSFGSSRRARYENACTPLYDFNSCYDSSRHIEARHWLAQPSDNKICVSGNCFPSGGENNKIGGGVRGFSLSVSQGLSGKHNCFVGASLEPISRPTHALALRSATIPISTRCGVTTFCMQGNRGRYSQCQYFRGSGRRRRSVPLQDNTYISRDTTRISFC
jgi:hypothetical protein